MRIIFVLIAFYLTFYTVSLNAQAVRKNPRGLDVTIGAYYFDGWSGMTSNNITQLLVEGFPERQPKWGWVTSSPKAVSEQIDLAYDAGISFFSFCWYYPEESKDDYEYAPLNRALKLFLRSSNSNKLRYNLMVANHRGFTIGPNDWEKLNRYWIKLFKSDQYLLYKGKPLITFYSVDNLISRFGSTQNVSKALSSFRALAIASGLKGVTIAACVSYDNSQMINALKSGFDVVSGYNYHQNALSKTLNPTPIRELIVRQEQLWNKISGSLRVPYLPVSTLNWDPRPQVKSISQINSVKRFEGYSQKSVYKSVSSLRRWLLAAPSTTLDDRIGILYAWNEYGEGAWLTPSQDSDEDFLEAIRSVLIDKL